MLNLQPRGIFQNGTVGVWTESRDYASGGFSFTPETIEQSFAVFGYQEAEVNRWLFQAAVRGDYRDISPKNERISDRIGAIRQRLFRNVSGSLATIYNISPRLKSRLMVMRSFRAPLLEELFNEGPHLAAYSFEVGNPDLSGETGLGLEWNLSYHSDLFYLKGTLFHNSFVGYIFPRNTGQTNFRTLLPVYQYRGLDARFYGAELESHLQVGQHWRGDLSMSFVRASLVENGSPLPQIPPMHGKLKIEYMIGQFSAGTTLRAAARQDRVDQFEEPTDGYAVVDMHAQYLLPRFSMMHSFSFSVNNIADTVYRKHLSRVKVIMPEPGRSFKFSYRVYF
jgi:iron complex outermembrane receptor protein